MGGASKNGQEHQRELGSIAGVQRIFVNGGYIIGPIVSGILAARFGIQNAFVILGAGMLVCFIPIITALLELIAQK